MILLRQNTTRHCVRGEPLSVGQMAVYRLSAHERRDAWFDLARWDGSGGTLFTLNVTAGVLSEPRYGPKR